MIQEAYVSYEVAKLLIKKGFNEPTLAYAYGQDMISYYSKSRVTNPMNIEADRIPLPTLQMVMKWLREVHNFHIWVEPNHDKEDLYNAHVKVGWWSNNWAGIGYNTYEQGCEEAIKYCLENLI